MPILWCGGNSPIVSASPRCANCRYAGRPRSFGRELVRRCGYAHFETSQTLLAVRSVDPGLLGGDDGRYLRRPVPRGSAGSHLVLGHLGAGLVFLGVRPDGGTA